MCKKRITCSNCKKETQVEFSNIGDMQRESNYRAIFDMECRVSWLCKDCHPKAEKLAKELLTMLNGNDNVVLFSLVDKK